MLEGDDSNESTESVNVLVGGFRGFGANSPGPSAQQSSSNHSTSGVWDANERVRNAISILNLLCDSCALQPHLHQLLGEK
jgi:hypothetical protein